MLAVELDQDLIMQSNLHANLIRSKHNKHVLHTKSEKVSPAENKLRR